MNNVSDTLILLGISGPVVVLKEPQAKINQLYVKEVIKFMKSIISSSFFLSSPNLDA